ncbi:MAG: SurA N-terminal domain-containing protein, partial [Gemmataceae bacterium]|nr:SurA N-terminal domain-containing protein [Gemmataceae bacterium]
MRKSIRVAAALALGSVLAASAAAQQPGSPGAPQPGGQPVVPSVTPPPKPPEVRPTGNAATVNGKAIPEVAVYRALRQFPAEHKEMARKEIVAHLIENALIDEYLNALKINVEEKDVNKLIDDLKKELKDAGKGYEKELEAMMLTEAEFRTEVTAQMKWEKFVQQQGTDQALKQLFDGSPDVFDGTMVRARHILMTPGTDEAKQKEAAQKLRGIKQVVEQEAAKAVAALPPTADAVA